jgi:hypothetical protein
MQILDTTARRVVDLHRRLATVALVPDGPAGRVPGPPRILFVTDGWGYGTTTMALAIAEELAGYTLLFAGTGPGFELARRASFDRLLRLDTAADPVPDELERTLSTCQAVVSVMNQRVARQAACRGIPCLYVDSLMWMWSEPPHVPHGVPYLQETFPGVERRLEEWRDYLFQPEIVGPLIKQPARARSSEPDAVLVTFGGLSSWLLEHATLVAYADEMSRCVLTALERWRGRVVISVGSHVRDHMDEAGLRTIRPDVELVDLGHDAYLAELRRSCLLISSAGMHAMYEAFACGVPCLCLPAQNLSGALAAEVLERMGVVKTLDWPHLYGLNGLDPADEVEACARIAGQIRRFSQDPGARARLVRHLRSSLGTRRLRAIRHRQAAFFAGLGELGGPRVAARLRQALDGDDTANLRQGA